jgi:hypothetical protein
MLTRKSLTLFIVLLLALLGVACTATEQGSVVLEPPLAETAVAEPVLDPAELTIAFYEWYMAYTQTGNPLVDKTYQDNPYLSPALVGEVDTLLASAEGGGYDPFLCAQDIPGAWRTGAVSYHNGQASVPLIQVWNPDSDYEMERELTVHLVGDDSGWLIRDIVCPPPPEAEAKTPEQVVAAFYDWYLVYAEHVGNPLADKAYHDSPYLTADLVQHMDEVIAGFDRGGYDPFLCAQDVPDSVTLDGVFMNYQTPGVLVRTSFDGHYFTVDLRLMDDDLWQISNVTCGGTPDGAAKAFYTWYMGYIGDPATDQFRNPLVDGAYRDSGFLTAEFIDKVDEIIAGFNGGGYDPFLLAQTLPQGFSVDPGYQPDTAIVGLMFGEQVKMVQVAFVEEGGRWLINDIAAAVLPTGSGPMDTSDWELFTDETYNFSFVYPPGWVVEALDMTGPGMPDDWPVVAAYLLMPPDIAEALAARSGPPDPDAPIIVAPIQLELIVGDRAAFDRVHVTAESSETYTINGQSVVLHRYDPGVLQAVFRPPGGNQLWLVFNDMVSEFPGREELATPVAGVFFAILETVTFD